VRKRLLHELLRFEDSYPTEARDPQKMPVTADNRVTSGCERTGYELVVVPIIANRIRQRLWNHQHCILGDEVNERPYVNRPVSRGKL
jgi:hypothetical protein